MDFKKKYSDFLETIHPDYFDEKGLFRALEMRMQTLCLWVRLREPMK